MTIRQPHEIAIRDWVRLVLEALDADYTVEWSHGDQHGARPPRAVLTSLSDSGVGTLEHEWTDEPGDVDPNKVKHRVSSQRRVTFSVSLYGTEARSHARELELALGDQASIDHFDTAGIVIRHTVGSTLDEAALRSVRWDRYASIDFEAGYTRVRVEELDWIERARLTSNAGDLAGFDETIEP